MRTSAAGLSRLSWLVLLAGGLLAACKGGEPAPAAHSFVLVHSSDSNFSEEAQQGIIDGLTEAGWVRGRDYQLLVRSSQGDLANLNSIMDATAAGPAELVFVSGTPALQAALKKLRGKTVVFTNSGDPVAAGAGKSFTDHLPNVTGIATMSDFAGMVRLVKALQPGAKRIGTVFTPTEVNSVIYRDGLKKAALSQGIALEDVAAYSTSEVRDAADALCGRRVDFVCQIADNLTGAAFASIVRASRRAKIPLLAFVAAPVLKGEAAAGVARDYHQAGKDAAALALRILKGESPAAIPFAHVSRTRTIINKAAASACGLALPEAALKQADEVLER